jgi:hypothetical protein
LNLIFVCQGFTGWFFSDGVGTGNVILERLESCGESVDIFQKAQASTCRRCSCKWTDKTYNQPTVTVIEDACFFEGYGSVFNFSRFSLEFSRLKRLKTEGKV